MRIVLGLAAAAFLAAAPASPPAAPAPAPAPEPAGEAFYDVSLRDLKVTAGKMTPNSVISDWSHEDRIKLFRCALDGEGEAYLHFDAPWESGERPHGQPHPALHVRAPAGRPVKGLLVLPEDESESKRLVRVAFEIAPSEAKAEARKAFYEAKAEAHEALLKRGIAGSAWFRHESRMAFASVSAATGLARPDLRPGELRPIPRGRGRTDLSDTYDILTGGRAVSENLALDMFLRGVVTGGRGVKVDTLEGVSTKPFDWSKALKGKKPKADALASAIPADQHAIFFPTFTAMTALMDESKNQSAPILHGLDPRAEDSRVGEFYERQLCLTMGPFSRLLGPKVIRGVAMTGSDPYLKTGSDVAILFDCVQPALVLSNTVSNQKSAAEATAGEAEGRGVLSKGEADGIPYQACVSEDDSFRSYAAAVGDVVVVTNSTVQLKAILRTIAKKNPALDEQPEYRFFRDRYPLGDEAETALLVLPDAAIRRWCSPAWRIADSRRVRVGALLSEWQAENFEALAGGKAKAGPVESELAAPAGDEGVVTKGGVRLKRAGGLRFQTPIAENLPDVVTESEADAYQQWRRGYEGNWRNYFDPIAVRFTVRPDRVAADATVMPLIRNSDYDRTVEVVHGAEIAKDAGDRHASALLQVALAINPRSGPFREAGGSLKGMMENLQMEPLSWVGGSASLYLDDDKFWTDLRKADKKDVDSGMFFTRNTQRIPIAFQVEVTSSLKLAAFLSALRAFSQKTTPDLVIWENRTHRGKAYVRVGPSEEALKQGGRIDNFAVFYIATPKALVVTLSEAVLKRAIDRMLEPEKAFVPAPWRGRSLCVQLDRKGLDVALALSRDPFRDLMQERSWGNLPILNELRRRFPGKDPVALYERFWHARPVCPGGGTYAWNEAWKTMESTVYGHPGEPKKGPDAPAILQPIQSGNFGLTFEDDGLRASFELLRTPSKAGP